MTKKTYLCACILLVILGSNVSFGQSPAKFDPLLTAKEQDVINGKANVTEHLAVLVKGNIADIKKLVENNHGLFKYSYGSIAAIEIPAGSLPSFLQSPSVIRMEGTRPHARALNDTMRKRNHIVEAQMGQSPLTHGYDGKGVVVGIIDAGVDFLHPDFQDSTGGTRIKYLWDMNQPAGVGTPMPYGYGKAWSKKQIDSVMTNHDNAAIATMDSSGTFDWGHGSNVAGTAAGNGRSNGLNKGAAYRADLIVVAYNFTNQTPTEMTDATNYIYTKAAELGEPCVINASLGDYTGSHDGFDLQAQLMDSMITAQAGRVFVAAAGNSGNFHYHAGYNITAPDSAFSWLADDGYNLMMQLYADTANFRNVKFAIGVDKNSPDFIYRAHTNYSTIFPYLNHTIVDTVKNSVGQRLGIVSTTAQLSAKGAYYLEVDITPDSASYYWRFMSTGTGKFDCWSFDSYGNPTSIVYTGLPSPSAFPAINNYKTPDSCETVCSSFQCSSNVITVANCNNRNCHVDYNHVLQKDTLVGDMPGKRAYNSSMGPTRDGRIKPDITATGNYTLSCLPVGLQASYIANVPDRIDSGGWHATDGGTSMASPVVTGTAALLLQLHPNATNIEIKDQIIYCADQDQYTGNNLPDNIWGYGKVDAFKAMTGCALGINELSSHLPSSELSAYPNPMRENTEITYDFSSIKEYCTASIIIYDIMGKAVKTIELKGSKGEVTLDKTAISTGMYFYSLTVDGSCLKTEKLVVM